MGTLTFQATAGGSVNLLGPNISGTVNLTLPSADGTSGQPLQTNGSGTLSFANLAIANGGTGATSFTANQIHYGSFSQSAGLTFDGTNFATTGTATAAKLIPTGSSATGNGLYLPAANSVGISTNGTNAVYIDSNQLVGIGTSSPGFKLDVLGSANTVAKVKTTGAGSYGALQIFNSNTNGEASIGYRDDSDSDATAWVVGKSVGAADAFGWYNGSTRMVLDTSGNLLVGTTATSNITKLTTYNAGNAFIAANTATSNLTTPAMQVSKGDNNTTTSNVLVQFLTNGFVNGQGQINANGASAAAFGSFSDKRLKENIVDLPSQLEKIMALRPVEFDYVESIGGGHQIGFIAQEVETVYPDLVGVGENEMLTLTDLNKNDARLIKCIQEQQALITSLTARITALER